MLIKSSTPSLLEIEDDGSEMKLLGAVLILLGLVVMLIVAHRHLFWFAVLFGVLFLGSGILLVKMAGKTRHCLDRESQQLIIERQQGSHLERQEIGLNDIVDVVVEEHYSPGHRDRMETSTLYRLAYVLRNGQRIPWTSCYTSGQRQKVVYQHAVLEFLAIGQS